MKTLFICLIAFFSISTSAQLRTDCAPEEGPIYKLVEDMPHPDVGDLKSYTGLSRIATVQEYIQKHPDYMRLMSNINNNGTVQLTYTVGTKGCISNVLVRRESHDGVGAVIASILKTMPNWKPGKTLGSPVRVRQHIMVPYEGTSSLED